MVRPSRISSVPRLARGGRALRLRGCGRRPGCRPRNDPVDRRRHRSSETLAARSRRAGGVNPPETGNRSPARRTATNPRGRQPAQSPRRFRAADSRERVGESRRRRTERGRRAQPGCPPRAVRLGVRPTGDLRRAGTARLNWLPPCSSPHAFRRGPTSPCVSRGASMPRAASGRRRNHAVPTTCFISRSMLAPRTQTLVNGSEWRAAGAADRRDGAIEGAESDRARTFDRVRTVR